MRFSFSVNVYAFIPMVIFMVKNYWKLSKIGILGDGWEFFAWNLKKLSERAAKYTVTKNIYGAHVTIERQFGISEGHLKCLLKRLDSKIEKVSNVIITCVVL